MIELIFVACLTLAPDACEEHSKVYMAEIGLMGCMVTAQAQLAEWTAARPRFRVVRWSCRWVDTRSGAA
jgi:hypothetical protein